MYKCYGNCSEHGIPPPIRREREADLVIEEVPCDNIHDPRVWGSAWWFSLFNGCCTADEIIPTRDRTKYWKFIEGLPYMLPCKNCQEHAKEYVETCKDQKDYICSSRKNLTKFFVDFHNSVSKRKGNRKIRLEDVENTFLRSGPVKAIRVRYA